MVPDLRIAHGISTIAAEIQNFNGFISRPRPRDPSQEVVSVLRRVVVGTPKDCLGDTD